MPGHVFLEGESVNLRTVEREDAEFLRNGVNHPDVRVWMGNTRPKSLEQEEDFVEEVVSESDDIHLMICRDGHPKGIISLMDEDDEGKIGEVGIWLHPDFHGQGYGTEAAELLVNHCFRQLDYHKIHARARADNTPSVSLWEKLGFQHEGKLRDHTYADGKYRDVVYLGVKKGEWT